MLYLPRLALNKQIDPMMLLLQYQKQIILELPRFVVYAAAGHCDCFSLAGGGALFDEVFDVVVVDVVCSWTDRISR